MNIDPDIIGSRQVLERLCRQSLQDSHENFVVSSPGARTVAWAAKVVSNSSYNVYNVKRVFIGAAGTIPVEVGQATMATNLAEPFMQQGQLAEGTYVMMCRVGDKNTFYAPV